MLTIQVTNSLLNGERGSVRVADNTAENTMEGEGSDLRFPRGRAQVKR